MARRGKRGVSFEAVRELALALPGAEEGTSYGTPAFRVRRKLFARLREDGETLVVRTDDEERELLMEADPKAFFLTDHYVGYGMMLVRLPAVHRADLERLLEASWRRCAPKRLLAQRDAEG